MARSTVFQYKDRPTAPQEVGAELGVRTVLSGRLVHRGDSLVVRVELVDVGNGTRLWGRRFDRPLHDLMTVEEEIAREIADNLRFELNGDERARLSKRPTESAEAHRTYLKGRHVWTRWKTPEGMQTCIGLFEKALELDPLYARAFAGLADSYSVLGNVKALPPGEAYPKAKTAARQGLALDESLGELHTSLGFIHRMWDWDWAAAEAAFQRGIELNPSYATAHRWYAQLLSGLGRHEEAIAVGKRAVELDPLSLLIRGAYGDVLFYARRYQEAIALYRETLEVDPDFLPGHTDLARALELAGHYEEAITEFRAAAALVPKGPPEPSSGLAHVYASMGRREEALAIVAEIQEIGRTRYVSPYGIASIHACLGDVDESLAWLEKAHAQHDQTLVWIKVHPRLDGLRSEPRFQRILADMRLA
jgi:tetratricopeptide (TPR) repeat protein